MIQEQDGADAEGDCENDGMMESCDGMGPKKAPRSNESLSADLHDKATPQAVTDRYTYNPRERSRFNGQTAISICRSRMIAMIGWEGRSAPRGRAT